MDILFFRIHYCIISSIQVSVFQCFVHLFTFKVAIRNVVGNRLLSKPTRIHRRTGSHDDEWMIPFFLK